MGCKDVGLLMPICVLDYSEVTLLWGNRGGPFPTECWGGVLTLSGEIEFSETRTGRGVAFICVELHAWDSKVPFPLTQSWKKCNWAFSGSKRRAVSSEGFLPWCSRGQLSIRLVACSPSAHLVGGGGRGRGVNARGAGAGGPPSRSQLRANEKPKGPREPSPLSGS